MSGVVFRRQGRIDGGGKEQPGEMQPRGLCAFVQSTAPIWLDWKQQVRRCSRCGHGCRFGFCRHASDAIANSHCSWNYAKQGVPCSRRALNSNPDSQQLERSSERVLRGAPSIHCRMHPGCLGSPGKAPSERCGEHLWPELGGLHGLFVPGHRLPRHMPLFF
jgi:hypothetical protein